MPAGLQVINEYGTIQIDQDYINLCLSAKGTMTTSNDGLVHPQPMEVATISVNGSNPLLALRGPTGKRLNVERVSVSGNIFTFRVKSQSSSSFTFSYWVFDKAEWAMSGNLGVGLQVFKGNGEVAFDSGSRPLRIVDVVDFGQPTSTIPNTTGTFTQEASIGVPGGRTFATIQGANCYVATQWDTGQYSNSSGYPEEIEEDPVNNPVEPGGPPPGSTWRMQYLEGFTSTSCNNGSSLLVGISQFEEFKGWYPMGSTPHANVYGNVMFLIVDVTGY